MNTLLPKVVLFSLVMSVSLSSWAMNPCMQIAKACSKMGFYKGGDTEGKGLIMNCVLPTANNQQAMVNMPFSAEQRKQCHKFLAQRMKGRMAR